MEKLTELYALVRAQSRIYDKRENVNVDQTFDYHIEPVIKNAVKFAEMRGGDVGIAQVAALFHDWANLVDMERYGEVHHIASGYLAEPILLEHGFDCGFVDRVKDCIFSHRGSAPKEKMTVEGICLADADGVAHIENAVEIIMWRAQRGDSIKAGNEYTKNKLKRTFAKLSDRAKEYIRDRYEATMRIFY